MDEEVRIQYCAGQATYARSYVSGCAVLLRSVEDPEDALAFPDQVTGRSWTEYTHACTCAHGCIDDVGAERTAADRAVRSR